MSEQAFIRVAVPADLRERYKAACLELGMSMGDQAALLFRSWVEGHETGGLGGSLDFLGRSPGTEELESEALPLIDEIHVAFEAQTRKLMGAIQPSAARLTELERLVRHGTESAEKRISQECESWRQSVDHNNTTWRAQLARERDDWRWLGGACGAGMLAAGLLLWALSGTGLGRSIATGLAGGGSRWQAALLLAGDGSILHTNLMSATAAMLKVEQFRDDYGRCIGRTYKTDGKPIACRLSMPPLHLSD
jgi:hypothetical protein